MMKTVFVSIITTFLIVVAVGVLTAPSEEPQEVLKVYDQLAWLSKSLDQMVGELRELDELLAKNWTAVRFEDRVRLQREVNDLAQEYAEAAGNYNRSMNETGYRFADPARLPVGATFGPLPERHEPFILLKSGPRA